jgi:hypothetical protein
MWGEGVVIMPQAAGRSFPKPLFLGFLLFLSLISAACSGGSAEAEAVIYSTNLLTPVSPDSFEADFDGDGIPEAVTHTYLGTHGMITISAGSSGELLGGFLYYGSLGVFATTRGRVLLLVSVPGWADPTSDAWTLQNAPLEPCTFEWWSFWEFTPTDDGKAEWSLFGQPIQQPLNKMKLLNPYSSAMPEGVVWCDHLQKMGKETLQADITGDGKPEIWTFERVGAHSKEVTISRQSGEEIGLWFTDGGFSCVHNEDGTPLLAIRNRHLDNPIESDLVQLYLYDESATPKPWVAVGDPFRSDERPVISQH